MAVTPPAAVGTVMTGAEGIVLSTLQFAFAELRVVTRFDGTVMTAPPDTSVDAVTWVIPAAIPTERIPVFAIVGAADVPPIAIPPVPVPNVAVVGVTPVTRFDGTVMTAPPDTSVDAVTWVVPAAIPTERIPVFAIVGADDVPPIAIPPVPVPNVAAAGVIERTPVAAVAFTIGSVGVPVIVTPEPAVTDLTAFPPAIRLRNAHTELDVSEFATTIGPTVLPII
jgi:hypothetical protein